jgi:hypothetical protein
MLKPTTKQVSPSVESVRYVPEKPPKSNHHQVKYETDDSDTSESEYDAIPSRNSNRSARGQKAKSRAQIQRESEFLAKELQVSREKNEEILKMCRKELQIRNTKIQSLEEQVLKKSDELEQLQEERENQEERLREAQRSAFRHMKQGQWVAQEDNSIRSELIKFEGELRSWAKKFAIPDPSALREASTEDLQHLLTALYGAVRGNDFTTLNWVYAESMKDKSPFLLMHAMLAAYIKRSIFKDPFFFFQSDMATLDGCEINHAKTTGWQGKCGFGGDINALYVDMIAGE